MSKQKMVLYGRIVGHIMTLLVEVKWYEGVRMADCSRKFEKFVVEVVMKYCKRSSSKLPVGTEENHDSSWSGWSAYHLRLKLNTP